MSCVGVLLCAFCILSVGSAQSPQGTIPASSVTDALLAKDAAQYPAFESGDTGEELIAKHVNFDETQNAYIVSEHLHEEPGAGRAPTTDRLVDLKTLVYNCDAIVMATPTRSVSS